MASVPRLPVIQAKPVSPQQQSQMQQANRGSGVLDPTRTGTDPFVISRMRASNMGSFAAALSDELKAFDPRTIHGLVDLAAMFTPGPKGGWVAHGPLTRNQAKLLQQLNNFERVPEGYAAKYGTYHRNEPGGWRQGAEHDFASVFGLPKGNPLIHLIESSSRPREPSPPQVGKWPGTDLVPYNPQNAPRGDAALDPTTGYSKLGMYPDQAPTWMMTKQENAAARQFSSRTPRNTDPRNVNADYDPQYFQNLSIDQLNVLSMIMRTIMRRNRPGPANLEGYGGN